VSRQLQLTSWNAELAIRFPDFTTPVVAVLALYSFGMILAEVSGLAKVVLWLAKFLSQDPFALRKRLREFYLDAKHKSGVAQGQKRRDFDVTTTSAPLLRWILSLWSGRHLPLAIDVTNLGERFHVLCVSVVVRGTALPVAWKVLHGGCKEPWGPHWKILLTQLRAAVPADWTVVVLSDRGLESPQLFRDIVALGWHPLMRVKKGGKFRPTGWRAFYYLHELAPRLGTSRAAKGLAYTGERLPCTLLARWEEGYAEPWLVLTDLEPEAATAVWYGLRTWIEQGFKVIKGGGWDWAKTRMEDPERVERLWLVLAVATLWVVAIGIEDEEQQAQHVERQRQERAMHESGEQAAARQAEEAKRHERQRAALAARRARQAAREAARKAQRSERKAKASQVERGSPGKQPVCRHPASGATASGRTHRVSVRGLAELAAAWEGGKILLPQHLHPELWPPIVHVASPWTEEDFLSQQT
jgi:hypothetical protein